MSPSSAFEAAPQSGLDEAVAVHLPRLSDVPGVLMDAPIGREYVSSLLPVRTALWYCRSAGSYVTVIGPSHDLNVKSWVGSKTLVAAGVPPLRTPA